MGIRDSHVIDFPPDWSRRAHQFHHLDGRAATRRSLGARRTAVGPAWHPLASARREYQRGLRRGFLLAAAFYTIGSAVLVLAFRALGVSS